MVRAIINYIRSLKYETCKHEFEITTTEKYKSYPQEMVDYYGDNLGKNLIKEQNI